MTDTPTRRLCGQHIWSMVGLHVGRRNRCIDCDAAATMTCVAPDCVAARCLACHLGGVSTRVATLERLRDPAVVAEILREALGRQLSAHGVDVSEETVRAVAANVAYAISESAR